MFKTLIGMALMAGAALAATEHVCVRNYTTEGLTPCNNAPKEYAWVVPVVPTEKGICTRIYPASYCEQWKEFEWVVSEEGREICVLNNDQPGVVNMCDGGAGFLYIKRKP